MDTPNLDNLQRALTLYRKEMREFIVRNLKRVKGTNVNQLLLDAAARNPSIYNRWQEELDSGKDPKLVVDIGHFPRIVHHHWRDPFRQATQDDKLVRNRMSIIAAGRNEWAHPGDSDLPFAVTVSYLVNIEASLKCIGSTTSADEVSGIIVSYQPIVNPEPVKRMKPVDSETEKPSSKLKNGLKPWSEVVTPHIDVMSGDINASTFAADLQEVADGNSRSAEYGNSVVFFNRSHVTPGLQRLLGNTIKRINGNGGDPVIQLKTGFGGGKTHSLIALYHLVNFDEGLSALAANSADTTGTMLQRVFEFSGVEPSRGIKATPVVLSGTVRSATEEATTHSGDPLNTLWGHMANELGGQSAYNVIGNAARRRTAPGGAELDELFRQFGPAVILMDELVAYARNLVDEDVDRFYTFLQSLTESIRRSDNIALVVTVPESKDELGGDLGVEVANRINGILERIDAVSVPLETDESFEVVRRRLMVDVDDMSEIDRTCSAFHRMYRQNRSDYPGGASHANYLEKLKACYPIHPEVFDRLHNDWSSIHSFQRTRGVLRLMALAIRRLHNQSRAPLIMPGDLPLADSEVSHEFTKVLGGNWNPVVDEIDGINSKADAVDQEVPRFRRLGDGAAKRVARTIFLGSVPGMAVRGAEDAQILLGTVEPNHGISDYKEALDRLSGALYFLHTSNGRSYLHTQPNLLKLHQDTVDQIDDAAVDDHIRSLLNEAVGRRIGDVEVVVFPDSSSDVQDRERVQLVVLKPGQYLPEGSQERDFATGVAIDMFENVGDQPRIRRNMVVFLTSKRKAVSLLRTEVRKHLAWISIVDRAHELNIRNTPHQAEASRREVESRQTTHTALVTSYQYALVPSPQPNEDESSFEQVTINAKRSGKIGQDLVSVLKHEDMLNDSIDPSALHTYLKRFFWKDDVPYLNADHVWDRMTELVYLPRLTSQSALNAAIAKAEDTNIYATATRYENGEFIGLSDDRAFGEASSLIVRWEDAQRQLERRRKVQPPIGPGPVTGPEVEPPKPEDPKPPTDEGKKTRARGSRTLTGDDALRTDYNRIRDEIMMHLGSHGGQVQVHIAIEATNEDGFSEAVADGAIENGNQLGFPLTFGTEME